MPREIERRSHERRDAEVWTDDERKSVLALQGHVSRYQKRHGFTGFTVKTINGYKIIEGTGVYGGDWAAKGHKELVIFGTRREAEEHAEMYDH